MNYGNFTFNISITVFQEINLTNLKKHQKLYNVIAYI